MNTKFQKGQGSVEFSTTLFFVGIIALAIYFLIIPITTNVYLRTELETAISEISWTGSETIFGFSIKNLDPNMAYLLLLNSVNSHHFNNAHNNNKYTPKDIKEMILRGSCQPISVYACEATTGPQLIFICPISSSSGKILNAGLLLGVRENPTEKAVGITAFTARISFWQGVTESNYNCTFLGIIPH